jgi:hypothetical protein
MRNLLELMRKEVSDFAMLPYFLPELHRELVGD